LLRFRGVAFKTPLVLLLGCVGFGEVDRPGHFGPAALASDLFGYR
jgi:hypothetical protein